MILSAPSSREATAVIKYPKMMDLQRRSRKSSKSTSTCNSIIGYQYHIPSLSLLSYLIYLSPPTVQRNTHHEAQSTEWTQSIRVLMKSPFLQDRTSLLLKWSPLHLLENIPSFLILSNEKRSFALRMNRVSLSVRIHLREKRYPHLNLIPLLYNYKHRLFSLLLSYK